MLIDWTKRTEPADLPEWMDEPCSLEELRACLRDLGRVNTFTFGYKPTFAYLDALIARRQFTAAAGLRILDVGFGGGDTLHRIAQWARAKGIQVSLAGIDLNPLARTIAQEHFAKDNIEWLSGDALAYTGDADVILSSLLTHHLAMRDVVRFVRWMEARASAGWFVNDLHRSARSARIFAALARILRWHAFVQHDGPVSFARSFVPDDWRVILKDAGVPPRAAAVAGYFPGRLCVSRFK